MIAQNNLDVRGHLMLLALFYTFCPDPHLDSNALAVLAESALLEPGGLKFSVTLCRLSSLICPMILPARAPNLMYVPLIRSPIVDTIIVRESSAASIFSKILTRSCSDFFMYSKHF